MFLQNFTRICLFSSIYLWLPGANASDRFIPLDSQGTPIITIPFDSNTEWPCVLDRQTGLIWEVKTRNPGLHSHFNRYSWFNPDPTQNGGNAGQAGDAACHMQPCDTNAFVNAVNESGWCNAHDWRIPTREELRSLVNYRINYPGPVLNKKAFPYALSLFYWSANSDATHPDEAWGMGFAFGFDYAYYKNNQVPVRLVRQKVNPGK